jgi:uncharacterized protein YraI
VYYEELAGYDLWLARWAAAPGYDCAIWQYTDRGKVEGIHGDVDLNWGYKVYGCKGSQPVAGEALAHVNVRAAPAVNAAPLGKLNAGTKVRICGTEGEWERIRYDGRDAYVHGAFIAKGKAQKGVVCDVNTALNLRGAPNMQANVLRTLPKGAVLEVYGKQGDWYHVRYEGVVGYAHGDHVRVQGGAVGHG